MDFAVVTTSLCTVYDRFFNGSTEDNFFSTSTLVLLLRGGRLEVGTGGGVSILLLVVASESDPLNVLSLSVGITGE